VGRPSLGYWHGWSRIRNPCGGEACRRVNGHGRAGLCWALGKRNAIAQCDAGHVFHSPASVMDRRETMSTLGRVTMMTGYAVRLGGHCLKLSQGIHWWAFLWFSSKDQTFRNEIAAFIGVSTAVGTAVPPRDAEVLCSAGLPRGSSSTALNGQRQRCQGVCVVGRTHPPKECASCTVDCAVLRHDTHSGPWGQTLVLTLPRLT